MTQEQKDLLLKDLCGRLPHGVKCQVQEDEFTYIGTLCRLEVDSKNRNLLDFAESINGLDCQVYLSEVKPYLFPISSMTEEHIFEINNILGKDFEIDKYGITDLIRNRRTCLSYLELDALFEYFNKYHFDYRGLIPMGLANDCTNLNIY